MFNTCRSLEQISLGKSNRTRWAVAEDSFLINNYPLLTNQKLAQILERTMDAVGSRARRLGLNVTLAESNERQLDKVNDQFFTVVSVGPRPPPFWAGGVSIY